MKFKTKEYSTDGVLLMKENELDFYNGDKNDSN